MVRGGLIVLALTALAGPAAEPPSFPAPSATQAPVPKPPKDHREFKEPGQFLLYHHKDWLPLPGLGNVVVTLAHNKGEAVVIVERSVTEVVPDTNTTDFMNLMADVVKNSDARAQNIVPSLGAGKQKGVQLDYVRAGAAGLEQLRLYTFLVGNNMFRITCIARPEYFKKHMTAFASVVNSVTAVSGPAPTAIGRF